MPKTVITVDPGIHSAAAFWRDSKYIAMYKFNSGSLENSADVVDRLTNDFSHILESNIHSSLNGKIDLVIIESVEFWASSAKSVASATRGNLSLLAYIVGAFMFACTSRGIPVQLISPGKWKGQLPYKALRNIIEKVFKMKCTSDHEASAIGIGLNYFGKL